MSSIEEEEKRLQVGETEPRTLQNLTTQGKHDLQLNNKLTNSNYFVVVGTQSTHQTGRKKNEGS